MIIEILLVKVIVVILVEATSMGAGSFLSETSSNELLGLRKHKPVRDGTIMFFSYFFAGFIPLLPYTMFPVCFARYVSVVASLSALFLLGFIPTKNLKSGVRMMLVAGIAALIGFLVAHIFTI